MTLATICPKSIQYSKGYTVITIDFNGQKYTYRINSISDGMVENSLATFATLSHLDIYH